MKRVKRIWIGSIFLLAVSGMIGCSPGQDNASGQASFEQVRDRFLTQQTYDYHGRTKLLVGNSANGNLVNFSGKKQGDQTYLKVTVSLPEEKRTSTMSLLSKNQTLYSKAHDAAEWQPVAANNQSLQQEFANWDPGFGFQQMDEMRAQVIALDDDEPKDGRRAFRVLLDSQKLKTWLTEQMKLQASSTVQAQPVPRLKVAMTLSDSNWQRNGAGVRVLGTQVNSRIQDIIDHMDVEAEYTVFYDEREMLPTNITMNIRSEYDLQDQRVQEHSEVETYLENYAQADTTQK